MTKLPAIILLGAFIIIISIMGVQHSIAGSPVGNTIASPIANIVTPTPLPMSIRNLDLAKSLVMTYNASHVYIEDVYDCDEMSYDLWDQATAKGLTAKIMMGNPRADYQVTGIIHAWVVVDVESNRWIALESTNGKINTSYVYMRGRMFSNPADSQSWLKSQTSGVSTKVDDTGAILGREVELTPFEVKLDAT